MSALPLSAVAVAASASDLGEHKECTTQATCTKWRREARVTSENIGNKYHGVHRDLVAP